MFMTMKHHPFIMILMLSIMLTLMIAKPVASQNSSGNTDAEKLLSYILNDPQLLELFLTLEDDKKNNPEKYKEFIKRLRASHKEIFGVEIQHKDLCRFKICNMGASRRTRS